MRQARSGLVYKPVRKILDAPFTKRIEEIAQTKVRYGYQRIHVLLRREGWPVNHKRVHRLYKLAGLNLRSKRRSTAPSLMNALTRTGFCPCRMHDRRSKTGDATTIISAHIRLSATLRQRNSPRPFGHPQTRRFLYRSSAQDLGGGQSTPLNFKVLTITLVSPTSEASPVHLFQHQRKRNGAIEHLQ